MQNYLLTSPLKSSWQLTSKNYVLNHDALFDYKMNDTDKEFIFLDPYGIDIEIKKKNEKYIEKLVVEIQKDLSSELNKFHNENYENRYWKVITGNWLKRAIKIIFYRYKCVERAINSNLNLFTTASYLGDYNFYTKDSTSLFSACMNSEWNYNLVSSILRHSFVNKIDIQDYKSKNNFLSSLDFIEKEKKKNIFKIFSLYAYSVIQNLLYPLYKKNN